MAEGIGFLLASAVTALLVTFGAAKLVVTRWPQLSQGAQTVVSALGFPAVAVALFALATAVTLIGGAKSTESGTVGMVVFALVFFLVYALVIGAAIGIPTAIIAVRSLRG